MNINLIVDKTSRSEPASMSRLARLLLAVGVIVSAVTTFASAQGVAAPPTPAPPTRPITPLSKLNAPFPPAKAGCYRLVNGKWEDVPCSTDQELRDQAIPPPTLQNGVQSDAHGWFRGVITPFVWGSVAITFISNPTQATETDQPGNPNSFSIQTNTNVFDCSGCTNGSPFGAIPGYPNSASQPGDKGWVQFVYTNIGTKSALCVWIIDRSVAHNTRNQTFPATVNGGYANAGIVGYHRKCVSPPVSAPLTGAGAPQAEAEVAGSVICASANACNLWVLAYLPWGTGTEGEFWSISAPDTMGLGGHWFSVDGSILGSGGGAKAVFTNTQIQQVVHAYSCVAAASPSSGYFPTPCVPATGPIGHVVPAIVYALRASANVVSDPTAESNNLTNQPSTFACGLFDCWLTYNSTAP